VPAAWPWARRDDLPGWNQSVFPAGRPVRISGQACRCGAGGAGRPGRFVKRPSPGGREARVGSGVMSRRQAGPLCAITSPGSVARRASVQAAGGRCPCAVCRRWCHRRRRRHEGWVGLGRWPKIPCGEDVRHKASHDRYESGLRDGSADFERSWTLASIPASAAHLAASCRSALCAGAPGGSLCTVAAP